MTFLANVGPSGTSMAPPSNPAARPTLTARTTGLAKMNFQPSFTSAIMPRTPDVDGTAASSPTDASSPTGVAGATWWGRASTLMHRQTMKAVSTNVSASK